MVYLQIKTTLRLAVQHSSEKLNDEIIKEKRPIYFCSETFCTNNLLVVSFAIFICVQIGNSPLAVANNSNHCKRVQSKSHYYCYYNNQSNINTRALVLILILAVTIVRLPK